MRIADDDGAVMLDVALSWLIAQPGVASQSRVRHPAQADQIAGASVNPVYLYLGKRFQRRTETLAALARSPGKALEAAMIGSQKCNDPVGFAVIGVVENDGLGNL